MDPADNPYLLGDGLGVGTRGLQAAANVVGWLLATVTAPFRHIRRPNAVRNGGDLGIRDFGADGDPGRFGLLDLDPRGVLLTDVLSVGDLKGAAAIMVLIPGNPGNAGFYRSYMAQLVKRSGGKLACISISHLGHSTRAPPMPGQRVSYREQVAHMARALERLQDVHPHQQFILAGHSIGARMIFELREAHKGCFGWDRVVRYLLLFPTLGHLGASKAGHSMFPVLAVFPTAAANVVTALTSVLPTVGLRVLTQLGRGPVSRMAQDGMLQIIDGAVIANCFHMALGEMQEVLDIPEIAPDVQEKIVIYTTDAERWLIEEDPTLTLTERRAHPTPGTISELETAYPRCRVHRCDRGYVHAFVLKASGGMADLSWGWIAGDLR